MENVMSSKPVYERIIFNRDQQSVQGFTFEKESDISYTESYTYKKDSHDATKTIYNMFLYKNPGLKKFLRFKCHSWGVQTLEQLVKKELEIKTKLREGKEMIIEKTEKLIETKDMIKEKIIKGAEGVGGIAKGVRRTSTAAADEMRNFDKNAQTGETAQSSKV